MSFLIVVTLSCVCVCASIFFYFSMGAIQIIHCLMLVSLLGLSLTHLRCPSTLSICHSNTYAQSRGKGEGRHQKQMPKLSSRGLQQNDYPISAVVWPDCCPGIFPNHRRFKDNVLFRSRNHDSADQCVSHTAESADGKAITQALRARLCPLLSLGQISNSYCIIQGRKRTFYSCIFSFIQLFSVCIQA